MATVQSAEYEVLKIVFFVGKQDWLSANPNLHKDILPSATAGGVPERTERQGSAPSLTGPCLDRALSSSAWQVVVLADAADPD